MRYPRYCFSINSAATRNAMADYDRRRENWYRVALELYPDYYNRSLKDRLALRPSISAAAGYSL